MIDVSHQDVCSLSVRLPNLHQSRCHSHIPYSLLWEDKILTASSGVALRAGQRPSRAAASSASYGYAYGPSFEKELSNILK